MEDSFIQETEVEHVFLYEVFDKFFPFYLSIGMDYDLYWNKSPELCKQYYESYKLKQKYKDEELLLQGMYIYEALCDVSPILHAFSKSGTKPLPYRTKSYSDEYSEKCYSELKEKEKEAERLKSILFFKQWTKNTANRFKKGDEN